MIGYRSKAAEVARELVFGDTLTRAKWCHDNAKLDGYYRALRAANVVRNRDIEPFVGGWLPVQWYIVNCRRHTEALYTG